VRDFLSAYFLVTGDVRRHDFLSSSKTSLNATKGITQTLTTNAVTAVMTCYSQYVSENIQRTTEHRDYEQTAGTETVRITQGNK